MGERDAGDGRRLSVVWSQEERFKRTWAERTIARYRRAALLFVLLLVTAAGIVALGGIVLAEQALHPRRHRLDAHARDLAADVASRTGATLGDATIVARDGVLLRGWYFTRTGDARGTAVLLHGVSTNRSAMLGFAELLLAHGYRVLATDARAHGASGGPIATYGVLERQDLRAWTGWVRDRHPDECVFGVGASMGAAILLQTLHAETYCAAVAEAPFAEFREIALFRLGRGLPLPLAARRLLLGPFVASGVLYTRLRYGIALDEADALPSVARTRVPVLLVHGTDDDSIPARDAERLAQANPDRVEVWIVPGGRHVRSWHAAPEEFPRRLLEFLDLHQ